jgi:hypothetical protein
MTIIRTKTAMTILFSLFALQTIGCASITNSYDRYERVPGELNWSFDDALQLEKNGRLVAEAGDWSGLDKAVACVPKAGKFAKRATSQAAIGTFLTYGGAATMAVSGAYALSTDFDQAVYGAAGLIGGLTGVLTGLLFQAASTPNAVDAVNYYNDHYDSQNGCQ